MGRVPAEDQGQQQISDARTLGVIELHATALRRIFEVRILSSPAPVLNSETANTAQVLCATALEQLDKWLASGSAIHRVQ